jgi:hypothetical protein
LSNSFNMMTLQTPPSLTEWVTNSSASNHTTPDPGNIFHFRPANPTIPSSIVVGNRSILPVTSVGDTDLPGPFYLNNVLDTHDIIKNPLSVHQFTTDNLYSIEFGPFGLSVKDLATRNVITRCNSLMPRYTISHPTTRAPQASTYYALTANATPTSLCHRQLSHPSLVALLKLSTSSASIYVRNLEMFLSAMLVSSVDILDFHSIGHHLMPHNVLI